MTMRTALLVVLLAGCSSVPGDPNTLVVNGNAVAGYAWAGPKARECVDAFCETGVEYVSWQIWFTNTDYCPNRSSDVLGVLFIISPEQVPAPSAQLPMLASNTISIVPDRDGMSPPPTFDAPVVNAFAEFWATSGTLTLTTFSADMTAGTFSAMGSNYDPNATEPGEFHGTFTAHACSRIH